MNKLDELIAEAELGEESRNFLNGNLGKCILGIAEQQVRQAQIALGEVDPDDKKTIVSLQNEIKLGERFPSWLVELLKNGENAMSIYKQEISS